eukprot:Tbor_TRINITY_DN5733_c1_g1::TRINITY_DN5733_c1_g1_i1::g.19863::m.19863/K02330/POLB; DNA polymerase beta
MQCLFRQCLVPTVAVRYFSNVRSMGPMSKSRKFLSPFSTTAVCKAKAPTKKEEKTADSAEAVKKVKPVKLKSNPVAIAVAEAVSTEIPKGTDPHRDNVISIFKTLAGTNRALGELHRAKAFIKAMQLLADHALANPGVPLTSAEQVKHLKGIGPKLYIRIDEIIRTGTLRELDTMLEDPNMNALMSISAVQGIGPKTALRLHKAHHISTVDELRAKVSSGDVELNTAQSIGLSYHEDFVKKIPFNECVDHGEYLQQHASRGVHKDLCVTICGSHRRRLPYSGDIDVLLTLPAEKYLKADGSALIPLPTGHKQFLTMFIQHLKKEHYILDTLSLGDTKYMGVCKLKGGDLPARRIDVRWVAPQCFPTALLYFTGSKVFNARMREYALGKGYSLSEYGLYKLNELTLFNVMDDSEAFRVPVKTEKEIFDIIGMDYILPEQRTA